MRRILGRILADRRVVGGLLLVAQLVIVMYSVGWMSGRWLWAPRILTVLSVIIVIWLVRKYDNPTYKISWIIVILLLPLFGGLFYLLWGNTPFNRARTQHKYEPQPPDFTEYRLMPATEALAQEDPRHAARARYITALDGMPAWTNTEAHYFRVGEDMFASMCEELWQAHKFIFLEYFIIEEGIMWNTILDILQEKVREGVDVRILYDDVGSIATLPQNYDRFLASLGIRAVRFNRFIPTLNTYLNYRNHRKMMIIDGNVGYMGGINLADEYINEKVRFGHWKDTGIMVKGDAVTSFTMMFLQMWNITEKEPEDYGRYLRDPEFFYPPELSMEGFVIPYGDSPLDQETVGELVYLDIINTARNYVHIMTPYLILNYELVQALQFAAKRGVETIIIMPHIPDKEYAFLLAKAHYEELIRAGVQIYEYTPGFVHAKVFTSDDEKAVVGTINMDYRSLYLHFECAAYIYRNEVIKDVERDFKETLAKSQVITLEECRHYPWYKKFAGRVLRLFAPLM